MGRKRKWALDEWFIWRWTCRALVVILVFYWIFNGSEPSERWIGLIALLLGVNEFRVKIEKKDNDKIAESNSSKDKRVSEQGYQGEGEPPSLFADWPPMVDFNGI